MVLEANGTVRLGADSSIVVSDELHPPKQDREDPQDDLPHEHDTTTTTTTSQKEEEDEASSSSSSSTHTVPLPTQPPVSLQVEGSMTVEPTVQDKDDRTLLTVRNEDGTCTFDAVRGYWLSIDLPPSQKNNNGKQANPGGGGRQRQLEEHGTPTFQQHQHQRLDHVQTQTREVQDQQTQLETAIRTQQQQRHSGDVEERLEALERLVAQYQQQASPQ